MGKIANMAELVERVELSDRIKALKDKTGLTFKKLNDQIGRPCTTSTLQIRSTYPKKECSKKLLDKINTVLDLFEGEQSDTIAQVDMLKAMRDEAIKDITQVFDEHIERIQHYLSKAK